MVTLIRSRPLLSFFVLACALSWLGWLNYILSDSGLGIIDVDYPVVLGSTQPLGVIPGAFLGPIGSALIVTAVVDGRSGLRAWAGRLVRWRANWRWYAVSLLAVPAGLVVVGTVASLVTGGSVVAPTPMLLALYVPVLVLQLVTTGLAEEPGWRDFALSRLQRRHGPLASAAILGPVWAVWHYPLFLTDWAEGPGHGWTGLLAFTVFCLGFNVLMSWMFNRTGASSGHGGFGLLGMRERAELVGARLDHGPTEDGAGTSLWNSRASVPTGRPRRRRRGVGDHDPCGAGR